MPKRSLSLSRIFFNKRDKKSLDQNQQQHDQTREINSINQKSTRLPTSANTPGNLQIRKSTSFGDFFRKLSLHSTSPGYKRKEDVTITTSAHSSEINPPQTPLPHTYDLLRTPTTKRTRLVHGISPTPGTDDAYDRCSISLDSIAFSPALEQISFDDNLISRSTTRDDSHAITNTTTSSASVTDANVQIYHPAEVKMIQMVEKNRQDQEDPSMAAELGMVANSKISSFSKSGTLEEEILHEINTPIYRLEMMELVAKHQSIVAKQEQEIAHLKKLLFEQRNINSLLMMTTPKVHSTSQAVNNETPVSSHKVRSSFIPIQIFEGKEREEEQKGLLPPIAWKRWDQDQDKSGIDCHGMSPPESSWFRKGSIISDVSSIMSYSHQKIHNGSDLSEYL
ncbi:hypothetical protein JA1_003923 [Spathaspora sp. JA1]|nr:hypothetical protein JA1_003923 [Spathaspora sp. JA1]